MQQAHHQVSPQFSPHHHPMTPNPQQHTLTMQQQHLMSPYSAQPQSMHHPHPQHSPTIVVQPQSQFSPSSVHHHQLTLSTTGHQSPPIDPTKRQIQMQKPPPPLPPPQQQLLVKHEPMSYDEQQQQQPKTEPHDESLNDSLSATKNPYQCKRFLPCRSQLISLSLSFSNFQLFHLMFSNRSMK